MDEQVKQKELKHRRLLGLTKIVITVIITLMIAAGAVALLLGRSGIALVEGWLLAKYAFVDTEADLDGAADLALEALIDGLGDRWSYYLDEEDYLRVTTNRANSYVGIGITVVETDERGLLVQSVTAGGPAEAAGVLTGDIVVAVDGISIAGEARYDAADLIRGEAGSSVTLTLLDPAGGYRDAVCVRKRMHNPSAAGKIIEGSVGYVYLANFYSGSAESFRSVVDGLLSEGAESLIVDIRNCPGGYVDELKEILDYLLPEGPVFTQKSRWWVKSVYESDAKSIDIPMVAIVNANSYSAAELLAAQMRESAGSPIVGEITSGKGYSQITFKLPNGGGIGLSTATYCLGSGHSLIGEGITPDVLIVGDADAQLQAAIELLK